MYTVVCKEVGHSAWGVTSGQLSTSFGHKIAGNEDLTASGLQELARLAQHRKVLKQWVLEEDVWFK